MCVEFIYWKEWNKSSVLSPQLHTVVMEVFIIEYFTAILM